MTKEKRILSYILSWLILGYIILFIGTSNVFAATFDDFEVTWYYRNKSNESQLLNVLKQEDVPLYASTNEYVNGYTTRVEQTFTKQIQYIINYQLEMWFSPEQELNYRSDTLQRIIDYSYVDSDFKILNTVANESWNRSSGSGDTVLTINVSMQVLALNNTDAIRFGVYTNDNISIGFYNHTDQIDYYLVNNISIEENANATIIDQNNQIINGQNSLQNSITNTEDSINQNIDDMESAIVDSNKETQEVIKDQFESCRDSINLAYNATYQSRNTNYATLVQVLETNIIEGKTYTISVYINADGDTRAYWNGTEGYFDRLTFDIKSGLNRYSYTFIAKKSGTVLSTVLSKSGTSDDIYITPSKIQIQEGSVATEYEEPNTEICTNKIDETNDALNNIGGALTDDSPTDMSGLGDSAGWLPAGPVDSILTLPLTLFTTLSNNLSNNTCTTAVLPLPFVNKNINLPCIKTLYDKIGITGTLFTTAGIIASCFILFNYLLSLYNWVDKTLTMRENTMPGYYDDNWGGGA